MDQGCRSLNLQRVHLRKRVNVFVSLADLGCDVLAAGALGLVKDLLSDP